jgi:hypothetical protein
LVSRPSPDPTQSRIESPLALSASSIHLLESRQLKKTDSGIKGTKHFHRPPHNHSFEMSAEVPVAIIGIGCKLPGGSDTKDLYYEFLRNKVWRHLFYTFVFTLKNLIQIFLYHRATE